MRHSIFLFPLLSIALLCSPMPLAASESPIATEVAEEPVNNKDHDTLVCPDKGGNTPCPV